MNYEEHFRRELELQKFHQAIHEPFAFHIGKSEAGTPRLIKKKTWITRFWKAVIDVKGSV
ncbi:hypothetical protein LBW89_25215 [Paenibacillus sp. alder61]|uniref:Uncharacterized protein n=1 Tax=Paenibacillus faecis TaxID=862114 RepID=A0A5D0CZ62_9BACL|nr:MULTISPECIES: hypothetical protein [Paenibacillus]MCA1296315.1 hypothetical protein [Paenibacillus sp. alder61]TYA14147.1 hypothetical protein FRY98_00205 [Paenibacillus faecis]